MTFAVISRRVRSAAFLACCMVAAGQESLSQSQVVHIAVQVRQLDGSPVGNLKAKDFQILASGKPLSVTVARPSLKGAVPNSVQTRLLLILPSETSSSSAQRLSSMLDQLKPAWQAGWQIAMLTAQGQLTPYLTNEQSLTQALHQPATPPVSYQAAINTLRDFPGRRLVMTTWNHDYGSLFMLRKAAMDVQAMLYNIGGDPYDNYSLGDAEQRSTPSLPAYGATLDGASPGPADGLSVVNNTEIWSAPAALAIDDVHAERSFHTALRDAISDARNYYDLSVEVDPDVAQVGLRISADGALRVSAQAYTLMSRTPPEVLLLSKTH
jgi:hypothetical protein